VTITAETCQSLGGGEPYDLGLTIDALIAVGGEPGGELVRSAA